MDNINSPFPIYQPSLPNSNLCEPASLECHYSKEPLNLGISIFAPVSSVPGSSSFFFLQPLLTGKVFASIGVIIAAQLFLFLADRFLGLESMPVPKCLTISPEQTVRISLSDLQEFLSSVSLGKVQTSNGQILTSALSPETPEIPLVVGLSIWGDFSTKPFSPSVFLLFPIFTFPGLRGAFPLLILELLTTIFVRTVVPPQTTGAKPLTDSTSKTKSQLLQFSPEDLLNLLNRFSKHFGT